ncbi:MAG: glycosyltransferase [Microthrixaceae bacterium]
MNASGPTVWADVTNTVEGSGTTGVQRAAKNLLAPLAMGDPRVDVRLVRWCEACQAFLALDETEQRRFREAAPPPERRVDRLPQRLRPAGRRLADRPALRRLNRAARRGRRTPHPTDEHSRRRVDLDGGTFLDLDASWHNRTDRNRLLPTLNARGVRTAALFHDLFPIDHPEWSDGGTRTLFPPWADAHLRHDDLMIGNSAWTLARALDRRRSLGVDAPAVSGVVHLSGEWIDRRSEERAPSSGASPTQALPEQLRGTDLRAYAVCVATLEPRKNHAVLLDALDRWADMHPELGLVLIGRIGWNTDELVRRIEGHPLLGRQLFWFAHADDDAMRSLLGRATVAAMPSLAEGFGLPVMEALSLGVPVVTTGGGALAEVGGDTPVRLPPDDAAAWADVLVRHATDADYLAARRAAAEEAARHLPTWAEARDELVDLLTSSSPPPTSR